MYWLVGLLLAETALEGLLCAGGFGNYSFWRKVITLYAGFLLAVSTTGLVWGAWYIWIGIVPFSLYRLVNLLRIYRSRLAPVQLHTVALRAFEWLVAFQVIAVGSALLIHHYEISAVAFNVLVVGQLLSAVVLLRASTQTWQSAFVRTDDITVTDKELPTLSVLVAARNETDDLDACLRALIASDYPKLEILAYDDCSANRRTPEIIRSFAHDGVRFIAGDIPDETRWLAKNYAYERLSHEASGDVLLFCGVDAIFEPHTLRTLVGLLEQRKKNMLSVMPLRAASKERGGALLQAMRYYWEVCLPRRFFKRPPVLSTCWLIRKDAFEHMGGLESVSRSISPEAIFARQAVVTDSYSFIRSDEALGLYSNKPAREQYGTSVRVRYPQLHKRLELVALVSLFELICFIGPLIGLFCLPLFAHEMAYAALWGVTLLCLFTTYALVSVGPRLTSSWYGWILMPVAFVVDLAILHISFWKYEFSSIDWKGRNVCIPVMQVIDRLPKA